MHQVSRFSSLLLTTSTALSAAACSDDPSPPDQDAAALVAREVGCPAVVAATVTAPGFAFMPSLVTLSPGDIVKFAMPASHDARSTDDLWDADFGGETCVEFDTAGTYDYYCVPHGFTGQIVVE